MSEVRVMKALQIFLNILLCVVLAILLSFTQIGLFDLMAAQSPRVSGIHISAGDDEEIGYFDAYAFWGTDIATGLKTGAKYRIRNWFAWSWWKTGMKWADVALDAVISSVKPIFVQVAQVNAFADYYGKDIDDFYQYLIDEEYGSEEALKKALYEVYCIYGRGYGEKPEILDGYEYSIEEKSKIDNVINTSGFETSYARWVRNNSELYNTIWKLSKYNADNGNVYRSYYNKFIVELSDGSRSIEPAVMVLYYQNILSVGLAIFFVIKYPIGLFQAKITYKRHRRHEDDD